MRYSYSTDLQRPSYLQLNSGKTCGTKCPLNWHHFWDMLSLNDHSWSVPVLAGQLVLWAPKGLPWLRPLQTTRTCFPFSENEAYPKSSVALGVPYSIISHVISLCTACVCVCLCMCIYIYTHLSLSLSLSLPLSLQLDPHEILYILNQHIYIYNYIYVCIDDPPMNSPNISIFIGYHPLNKSNLAMSFMRGLEDHSDTKNGPFFSGSTVRLGMGNPIEMNSWPRNNWKILPIKPDFFPWQFLPWVGSQSCHWRDAFRTDRASFASLRPERTQRKLRKMVG